MRHFFSVGNIRRAVLCVNGLLTIDYHLKACISIIIVGGFVTGSSRALSHVTYKPVTSGSALRQGLPFELW